jgi:hypothetical protein
VAAGTALVGRHGELAELTERIARACDGEGCVLLLTGPPGIGKSSLAGCSGAAGARRRHAGRDRPGAGRCDAAALALAAAARPAATKTATAQAAVAGSVDDAAAARFLALHQLSSDVLAAVPAEGLLVVLDDLQWADASSLALLRSIAGRLDDARIVVLATHRDLPRGGASALATELPRLLGELSVTSLRLASLDRRGVEAMLAGLGATSTDDVVEAVERATGGNPLFVRTVGRLLKRLPPESRTVDAVAALAGARELRDTVRAWTRSLPVRTIELLRLASVLGEEFAGSDVAAVAGLDVAEVLSLIDPAVVAEVVGVPGPAGRYRFAHAVVREVLLAELSTAERADTHRQHAGRLAAAGAPPAEIAAHWLRGAISEPDLLEAASWAQRAATAASAGLAWGDAVALLHSALDAAERGLAGPGHRARLLLQLAEAEYREGRPSAALASCRRASELARQADDVATLAAAALVVEGMGHTDFNQVLVELTDRALAQARSRQRAPGCSRSAPWHWYISTVQLRLSPLPPRHCPSPDSSTTHRQSSTPYGRTTSCWPIRRRHRNAPGLLAGPWSSPAWTPGRPRGCGRCCGWSTRRSRPVTWPQSTPGCSSWTRWRPPWPAAGSMAPAPAAGGAPQHRRRVCCRPGREPAGP